MITHPSPTQHAGSSISRTRWTNGCTTCSPVPAIVGNRKEEEMIRDREKLTQLTREHAGTEMEKLGLIIDSLQVQEIDDPTGYIKNMARPHAVAIEREARIAQAGADREATQKEQEADALKAQARRDSQLKQAGYQAEIDQATALAQQAGPLAEA